MEIITITEKIMTDFASWLHAEEKSEGTREKYLRDLRAFSAWLGGREPTKETATEWKEHLLQENYAPVMYADANGHEYIYKQIMGALDTTPDVDNRTNETAGTFDAEVSFEDKNKTAVVECDQACVVLAAMSNGSYIKLNAVKRTDKTYRFDLSGINDKYVLTVALKGDYNLDGEVTTNDVAQANKALKEETAPSKLQNYVFDMSGDGEISTNDVAQVNKQLVNETAFAW